MDVFLKSEVGLFQWPSFNVISMKETIRLEAIEVELLGNKGSPSV
jgi:hypothetical protein